MGEANLVYGEIDEVIGQFQMEGKIGRAHV